VTAWKRSEEEESDQEEEGEQEEEEEHHLVEDQEGETSVEGEVREAATEASHAKVNASPSSPAVAKDGVATTTPPLRRSSRRPQPKKMSE
jgi:hypothetical protein